MSDILTRIRASYERFRPRDLSEVAALHLARAVDDADSVRGFAQLIASHGLPEIIAAYRDFRSALERSGQRPYRALQELLNNGVIARSIDQGYPMVGVAVERRTISAAIFERGTLAYTLRREFSSDGGKAVHSSQGFARLVLERNPRCTIALESREHLPNSRRSVLVRALTTVISEAGTPIWPLSTEELYAGYGHPPCRTRKELHTVVGSIWPGLRPHFQNTVLRDAVGIGFYAFMARVIAFANAGTRKEGLDLAA